MDPFSTCNKCKYETPGTFSTCPQCGRGMQNSVTVRRLGWVALALGAFLTVFMTLLTAVLASVMAQAGAPEGAKTGVAHSGGGVGFSGTPKQAASILAIFVLVIAIGLTSSAGGIWQIKYGRKNKAIGFIILGLALLIIIVALSFVMQS
ncbi:MAG: hypothetical protein ACREDR_16720 [Blastocatellia bacterium]